jgi:hypothetical protein
LYRRDVRPSRAVGATDEAPELLDSGDERIDLHGSAPFKILQHRYFVTDDGTGCVQLPLHSLPMLAIFLAEQTQASIDLMLADRPIRLHNRES